MEDLVRHIVCALVDEPDAVEITVEQSERGPALIRIEVAEGDRGTVIGRQGRTIRAMETVINAASKGPAPRLEIGPRAD
jgi:predicted RNA-binding protein YlqC (UPF0109 family)